MDACMSSFLAASMLDEVFKPAVQCGTNHFRPQVVACLRVVACTSCSCWCHRCLAMLLGAWNSALCSIRHAARSVSAPPHQHLHQDLAPSPKLTAAAAAQLKSCRLSPHYIPLLSAPDTQTPPFLQLTSAWLCREEAGLHWPRQGTWQGSRSEGRGPGGCITRYRIPPLMCDGAQTRSRRLPSLPEPAWGPRLSRLELVAVGVIGRQSCAESCTWAAPEEEGLLCGGCW